MKLERWIAALCLAPLALSCAPADAKPGKKREPPAAEAASEPACPEIGLGVLVSPLSPWSGAPLRVLVTAEKPLEGELSLIGPDGKAATATTTRRGGPPYFWLAEASAPAEGKWQAKLTRTGADANCATITKDITVRSRAAAFSGDTRDSVWPIRDRWTRASENLYSAWIETLFDAPVAEQLSWPALHEVLRDKSRNVLFGHLGLREDEKGMVIRPDCADLPYFLRAYFAFKMGLPAGYSKCSRGGGGAAPRCAQWWNIKRTEPDPAQQQTASSSGLLAVFDGPAPKPARKTPQGLLPGFSAYIGTSLANAVHSGNGRTAADDDDSDYYPVALSEDTLRPGTIYADPYGHVLVISKRLPQTGDGAGVILAVDGQPDGTVARKRFWRGNFLFAQDKALGGPGFKRFRPIVPAGSNLRRLKNAEITKSADYGDYSAEQSKLDAEAFYDKMDDVMSPSPLDPLVALKEAITSLEEQVKTRVTSVENGRKYQAGGGKEAAMPDGAAIFETTGAWEDFATPSRDLRLLIAIDVVRGFPERVARRPERYAKAAGSDAGALKGELDKVLEDELASRKITYTRTDGTPFTLSLKDVSNRSAGLEVAYNVNDCVELRWGAAEGSDEASTCKQRAPAGQRAKMSEYRAWFHERRRPAR